jgi:diguanylate cyclase (GGDEF)-like protein/putative nucleotidyltransferase with HDIG domain
MFGNGHPDELLDEVTRLRGRIAELERERARGLRLDLVTGLLGAQAFRTRLSQEAQRARRYRRSLSVALVGVDDFPSLELRHGFSAADDLLATVARRLTALIRTHDVIGRTGPAEFGLLLPETSSKGALPVLERLLVALEHVGEGSTWAAGASVGVATLEADATPEALLADARMACGLAQAAGGGRAVLAASVLKDPERPVATPHRDAMEALAVALLERDRYTGEHSKAVIEMAGAVARELGLTGTEVERVKSAALLHDIGKVAIPDEILHKPGPLTAEEWKLMRQHPVIGERILRVLPGLGAVARIVRHEHERWDGGGYPDGLTGEQIPVGSRVILAADTYHAITTDRPYRRARSHQHAIDELVRCTGSQFDPLVTEILVVYLEGARGECPGGPI